jgi:hypothetical protein
MQRFTVQDNLFLAQNYPVFAGGSCTVDGLSVAAPGYVWTNTPIAGPWPTPVGCVNSKLPQGNGNGYPSDETSISYTNPNGGDYRLSSASPYKSAASDGRDIGVDWPSFDLAQDPANIPLNAVSTPVATETTTEPAPITSSTSTTTDTTTKTSSGRFLGKLKQLMDKVR